MVAQQQQAVPFRTATIERAGQIVADTVTMTTSTQRLERAIDGSGYLYSIVLQVTCTTASNAAAVAYTEDAPYNVLDTVVLRDVNGELLNVSGFNLWLANLVGKQYASTTSDGITGTSGGASAYPTDPNVYTAPVAGASGTGGSFSFFIRVPVGLNRRDLTGVLGNQDRAQRYYLRDDIAASGAVYSVSPTTLGTVQINRIYENYAVPLQVGPSGQPQQVVPDSFGVLHYLTATSSPSAPAPGTINHYLQRIGNTIRWIALVFRSNGSRATAETNAPTNILFKLGEDTIFQESYAYRRLLMYERFGFSFPKGVLVYDAMHDFAPEAGNELGEDYFHSQALVNAQFQITYPSGFGSTNNSLYILTDDLQDTTGTAG
ncbi:MAG: hypothetical protein KGJ45_11865 [Elusimicrobia bacterium]|nr:hypothetical protein [Elusimicrobiota bacterium]